MSVVWHQGAGGCRWQQHEGARSERAPAREEGRLECAGDDTTRRGHRVAMARVPPRRPGWRGRGGAAVTAARGTERELAGAGDGGPASMCSRPPGEV